MQIYNTGDVGSQFSNILVYGMAGSGKTPLAATAPNPIVISSEPGLKSLKHNRLPYIQAATYDQALDALKWCQSSREAQKHDTFYFDSISALSENICNSEKAKWKGDARKWSPETMSKTMEIVKGFLSIQNKHVVMTSKAIEHVEQLTGAARAECFAAVPKLGPALPYDFDDVLFISRHVDATTGKTYSALRCSTNDYCVARNRSGMLDLWEPANITHIINKSNGVLQ
jgi:hypothetical protein